MRSPKTIRRDVIEPLPMHLNRLIGGWKIILPCGVKNNSGKRIWLSRLILTKAPKNIMNKIKIIAF